MPSYLKKLTPQEFEEIKTKIFPIVKVYTAQSNGDAIKFKDENEPLYATLPGDLVCFYGVESESHYQLLTRGHLPDGVTLEALDEIATSNYLREIEDHVEALKTDWGAIMIIIGRNFESASFLVDSVWEYVMGQLGKDVVFAVPAKDLIFFLSATDTKGIKRLEQEINDLQAEGEDLLSKKIFKFNGEKVEVMKE